MMICPTLRLTRCLWLHFVCPNSTLRSGLRMSAERYAKSCTHFYHGWSNNKFRETWEITKSSGRICQQNKSVTQRFRACSNRLTCIEWIISKWHRPCYLPKKFGWGSSYREIRSSNFFKISWMGGFCFSQELKYLGRICHRKQCPASSIDCTIPRCGEIVHIRINPEFIFNPHTFLISPFKIFWTCEKTSIFEDWRKKLNITEVGSLRKLEPITMACIECGKEFVYSVAEQKIFSKRGFYPPKRCGECRFKKTFILR